MSLLNILINGKPKKKLLKNMVRVQYILYRPEMEIMAKYHQELIFISGMGMHVKNTVTIQRSCLFIKISSAKYFLYNCMEYRPSISYVEQVRILSVKMLPKQED
jgi:hypothetical protein